MTLPSRHHPQVLVSTLLAAALSAGCAGSDYTHDPTYVSAQKEIERTRHDPAVREHTAVLVEDAERTLMNASRADDLAQARHFAYLAQKKAQIASAVAEGRSAEQRLVALTADGPTYAVSTEQPLQTSEGTKSGPRAPAPAEPLSTSRQYPPEWSASRLPDGTQLSSAERSRKDVRTSAALQTPAPADNRPSASTTKEAEALAKKVEQVLNEAGTKGNLFGPGFTLAHTAFESGRPKLNTAGLEQLKPLVKYMRDHPGHKVLVEGHTDNLGNPETNLALSRARAEAIKAFLVREGVDGRRVLTVGYGANNPVANNTTADGRRKNQRVEIAVIHGT